MDRKRLVRKILASDSIPEKDTRIKIGMKTVLLDRSKEDIYESDQV